MTSAKSGPGAKVIIVGAGIAGPVLAAFLIEQGYHPVVYERTAGPSDRGIGHGVSTNGLGVLSKLDGLLENLESSHFDKFLTYSLVEGDEGILLERDVDPPKDGLRTIGVKRHALQKAVVDAAVGRGVEIRWGRKLVALQQHEDRINVTFEDGTQDSASFVVGCDGLHSNTRSCLFGEEEADYTGLVQIGGICPTPDSLKSPVALINILGNGAHMIALPVSKTHTAWAATMRELEPLKESWNVVGNRVADEIRSSQVASWEFGGGDIIDSTERFVKYGLYDRPELKTWHKGRVLLIGDAAHPTSPHLGQGANQALEDVDVLMGLLEKHNPSAGEPATATLETIFIELETERIPRSSAQVKAARRMGETRVVEGVDACLKRNQQYRDIFKDEDSVKRAFGRS